MHSEILRLLFQPHPIGSRDVIDAAVYRGHQPRPSVTQRYCIKFHHPGVQPAAPEGAIRPWTNYPARDTLAPGPGRVLADKSTPPPTTA